MGKEKIIALDNDPLSVPEPPLKPKKLSKITEYLLALQSSVSKYIKLKFATLKAQLSSTQSFFLARKEYLPHLGIIVFALIAGSTNIVSAQQKDSYASLALVDPATTAGIIKDVIDPYTPIVKDSTLFESKSTLVLANGFIDKPQLADTQITDRGTATSSSPVAENRTKTMNYTVDSGDTLSSIGWRYGVKIASIKYVNNLTDIDSIKPGQTLKVPPTGYEVTASKIAQKEKTLALASRTTTTRDSDSTRSSGSIKVDKKPGYVNNGYPYGWCTYYVATRRQVPTSMGNGGRWLASAKAKGMSTGQTPVAGAIMVTSESWAGHVAYVESVHSDGSFTVSEMNYAGWGRTSSRTVSAGSGIIKGFIY